MKAYVVTYALPYYGAGIGTPIFARAVGVYSSMEEAEDHVDHLKKNLSKAVQWNITIDILDVGKPCQQPPLLQESQIEKLQNNRRLLS